MEDLEDIARQQTYKPRRLKKKLDIEAERLFLTLQDLCHFQVIRMCCEVAEDMSIGVMEKIWSNQEHRSRMPRITPTPSRLLPGQRLIKVVDPGSYFEAGRELTLQTTMNNQNFKEWQQSLQTLPITILDEIKASS